MRVICLNFYKTLLCLILFFSYGNLFSQQILNIEGKITASDMPVSNALITFVSSTDTSIKYSALTDILGNYKLGITTGVKNQSPLNVTVNTIQLDQNYPNPFSSSTSIPYQLLEKQPEVTLRIFDILGREIKSFTPGEQSRGQYKIIWDGKNSSGQRVTAGVYFCQLLSGRQSLVRKMIFGTGSSTPANFSAPKITYPQQNRLRKEYLSAAAFNITIKSLQATEPQVFEKNIISQTLQGDTVLNFTVKEADSEYVLCYTKLIDRKQAIFQSNITGAINKNLSLDSWGNGAAWSPDGKYLAFENSGQIYLSDLEKETIKNLGGGNYPEWTPDGKQIVYYGGRYIMNADGSNKRKLLNQEYRYYFYGDGYSFIYKDGYNIYKTNTDNSSKELILDLKTLGKNYVNVFDFDPFRHELLILADPTPQITNLLLTFNTETKKLDTLAVADPGQSYHFPKFSSDYLKVAFEESGRQFLSKIFLLEGGIKTELFGITQNNEGIDFNPFAFSSDDKFFAFSKNVDLPVPWVQWDSYLYVIDLETKQPALIGMGYGPVWKPKK